MDQLLRTTYTGNTEDHLQPAGLKLMPGVVVEVVGVEYMSGYKLQISFSDGVEQVVDFEPFLRGSRNPMIREYLDPSHFNHFRVEHGDLVWDDYGLCFPIADLYENNL